MTCENCIHYDICNEQADGNIVELMKEPCFRFKDKDSFNVKWREWNTVPNKNGDLISRSALLEKIQPVDFLYGDDEAPAYSGMAVSAGDIESAPTVDATSTAAKGG